MSRSQSHPGLGLRVAVADTPCLAHRVYHGRALGAGGILILFQDPLRHLVDAGRHRERHLAHRGIGSVRLTTSKDSLKKNSRALLSSEGSNGG